MNAKVEKTYRCGSKMGTQNGLPERTAVHMMVSFRPTLISTAYSKSLI